MTDPYDAIRRDFECEHASTRLTVKVAANGVRSYRDQCVRCGHTTFVRRKADLTTLQMAGAYSFDEELSRRWWQARDERYRELRERDAGREAGRKERWDAWYARYLESPAWMARRNAVMRRANYVCEGCLKRPATAIHHLTYARAGREMLFDLVAICEECHGAIHEEKP